MSQLKTRVMLETLSSSKVRTRIMSELSYQLGVTGDHSLLNIEDDEISCRQGKPLYAEFLSSKIVDVSTLLLGHQEKK